MTILTSVFATNSFAVTPIFLSSKAISGFSHVTENTETELSKILHTLIPYGCARGVKDLKETLKTIKPFNLV